MKAPHKICHVVITKPYFDARIFVRQCTSLVAAGYETHLIAPGAPEKSLCGVTLHRFDPEPRDFFTHLKTMPKILRPLVQMVNAELYHLHDPELLNLGTWLKKCGRKVIYDVQDDTTEEIMNDSSLSKWRRSLYAWWFELKENSAARGFDLVVTANQYLRDRFHHQRCIAIELMDYPSQDELQQYQVDSVKKERAVAFYGDLVPENGLFGMLDAVDKVDSRLILIGGFKSTAVKEQALSHRAWRKVELVQPKDKADAIRQLARAQVGLVVFQPEHKYTEADPIQFSEYMLTGLPLIASNFTLWNRVIAGNQCGRCVDWDDSLALAKEIEWMLNHPQDAKILGQNGKHAALQMYIWEAEKVKLLTMYEKILAA